MPRLKRKAYCPYGGARDFWRCKDRWVLFDGPAGTGKTRAVIEKSYALCCRYRGIRALWVRKTRASMTETVLEIFESKVNPDPGCVVITGVARDHRAHYHFRNGSRIVLGGLDNVDRIMSAEYDFIMVFEATETTREEWEKLDTRLRNAKGPYHQMVAECNPGPPGHWLKQMADAGEATRILSRHTDNPSVTPEYLAALGRLTGHRRARLLVGEWTAAEGQVYAEFDEAVHVRETAGKWSRAVIGVDDGYTNPAAVLLLLVDSDGRAHVAREMYGPGHLHAALVAEVKRQCAQAEALGAEVEAVLVDPSAAKLIAELAAAELPVRGADNDVDGGIKTVRDYLAVAGDGAPRLTLAPQSANAIREFAAYAWARTADGRVKDKPEKANDHAMDALRYALMHLSKTGGSMEVFAL